MTAYFDRKKDHILHSLRPAFLNKTVTGPEEVEGLVDFLHITICLCMACPGFPDDLRDAVNSYFARFMPEPLPGVHQDLDQYADGGSEDGAFQAAVLLVDELHDVFHELGRRARKAPTNSPLSYHSDDPNTAALAVVDKQTDLRLAYLRQRRDAHSIELVRRYDANVERERAEAAADRG